MTVFKSADANAAPIRKVILWKIKSNLPPMLRTECQTDLSLNKN